jgi:hypothetical protein
MAKKICIILLSALLLLCAACSGKEDSYEIASTPVNTPATTEIIELYNDPYVPFYTADLAEVVNASDTIIIGCVEETLPAELICSEDSKYVQTPANIRVILSLKGDYEAESLLRINQSGGVAGGVDFRPASAVIHEQGETYLFFINDNTVLHSEHMSSGTTLDGYFFTGKTIDEASSAISDCIQNGRSTIDKGQIKSFSFGIDGPDGNLVYYIDKAELVARVTLNGEENPSLTKQWDLAKWDGFISALEACGVFNWERHYDAASNSDYAYWSVDLEIDIGYVSYQGTDVYPEEWDSFLEIIEDYMGSPE